MSSRVRMVSNDQPVVRPRFPFRAALLDFLPRQLWKALDVPSTAGQPLTMDTFIAADVLSGLERRDRS